MKSSVITSLLGALALSWAGIANANERWFEVELIVFTQTSSNNLKEQFSSDVKPIRLGNSIDLITARYRPISQDLSHCETENNEPTRLLPAVTCDEQSDELQQEQQLNSPLPMPASLPVKLAAEEDQHQLTPYLAPLSAFELNDLASKINRQPNQKVILHTVWRQVPVTERRAVPSRWFAGTNYSDLVDYWGQRRDQAATDAADAAEINAFQAEQQDDLFSAIDTLLDQLNAAGKLENLISQDQNIPQVSDSLSNVPNDVWQLDGLFKLHLDHYLFVNTEFNLRRPTPGGNMQSINVKQSRRVISGELHYLDHPYLGMVLQIRRYQPPEPEREPITEPQRATIQGIGPGQNLNNR